MSAFKKIPKSILIFGAAGHVGRPLAEFLTRESPATTLHLATSSPGKRELLQRAFPNAHVVDADYSDTASLSRALKDIEGVFVITPGGMSEAPAMTNLVSALKGQTSLIQVIRLVGVFPELAPSRQMAPVLSSKTFIWPEHRVPFIDPRDIGEVAGRLFLSDNAKHIGAFHTMNNGQDWLTFQEVTGILSEVLGEEIRYDGSYEAFSEFYGPKMGPLSDLLWNFFKFEEANEVNWALNNFVERTLGRKPTSVRDWIVEHKDKLMKR
ncbi:hypothetical protein BGZ61DRAFT_500289 [Ilyonectria robusta]|uniref:uncharacterized protein n=1 Tax=Ilyonectria robusta TaxID=1079257 RepID=UPI001E8CFF4C|nr:uncharacterized protein BGZ61DRAFT_500289 [Ilyonectria robusta]KAH8656331.1 hypothetical protein BGZ61DRAFT_500289 [Ilyonectria robusta]